MNEECVKSMITLQIINDSLLHTIDSIKNSKANISISDLLESVYTPYNKVETDYCKNHMFYNQYQLISTLYTYIVLPKESFFDRIPENIMTNELNENWGLKKVESHSLRLFIRRLRNSISHGNIEFTSDLIFTFVDNNQRKSDDIFNVAMESNDVIKFLRAFSNWCITNKF